jgi:hypothetical protein
MRKYVPGVCLWRDRWYFAEPFEAPEWRAQWVERMEA